MDIIIIGKESHNRTDKPFVVYCGQDRASAEAAAAATAGKFLRIYELNPEPFRPLRVPPQPSALQPSAPSAPQQPSAQSAPQESRPQQTLAQESAPKPALKKAKV